MNFIYSSSGRVSNITVAIHVSTLKLLRNMNEITYAHRWHIGIHDLQVADRTLQTSTYIWKFLPSWHQGWYSGREEIGLKFLKPGGDSLLHVGVCCNSLERQLLLKWPKYYSVPQLPTYQNYSPCIHLINFTVSCQSPVWLVTALWLGGYAPWRNIVCVCIFRVIQEETSLIWERIVSVIVRKGHTKTCLILHDYWDRSVWIYKYNSIMNRNKEIQI
jgi:hypothetical protein